MVVPIVPLTRGLENKWHLEPADSQPVYMDLNDVASLCKAQIGVTLKGLGVEYNITTHSSAMTHKSFDWIGTPHGQWQRAWAKTFLFVLFSMRRSLGVMLVEG